MTYSSGQVARKLGIGISTLSKYINLRKVPAPRSVTTGGITVYLWTEADIEHVRKLLPKIANGRKTRYKKLRDKDEAPAGVPVPHKKKSTQKKTQPRAAALPKKRRTKKKR
jgi:predicted DNA-binding transcriptional regulator AlpA